MTQQPPDTITPQYGQGDFSFQSAGGESGVKKWKKRWKAGLIKQTLKNTFLNG